MCPCPTRACCAQAAEDTGRASAAEAAAAADDLGIVVHDNCKLAQQLAAAAVIAEEGAMDLAAMQRRANAAEAILGAQNTELHKVQWHYEVSARKAMGFSSHPNHGLGAPRLQVTILNAKPRTPSQVWDKTYST